MDHVEMIGTWIVETGSTEAGAGEEEDEETGNAPVMIKVWKIKKGKGGNPTKYFYKSGGSQKFIEA